MTMDFDNIYDRYSDRLYAAAFNICRQQQDAEDAVQDAFIRLYHSHKDFESEEHIRYWLVRVTINECKKIWRSLRGR